MVEHDYFLHPALHAHLLWTTLLNSVHYQQRPRSRTWPSRPGPRTDTSGLRVHVRQRWTEVVRCLFVGSPFILLVTGEPNADRVRIHGPGIEHGVLSTFQGNFVVDTAGAGSGQLVVKVRGPKGLRFFVHTQSNPIQSNLYCKNTADRTQQDNRQTQRKPY